MGKKFRKLRKWLKWSRKQQRKKGESTPDRRKLSGETLEPRILLSATWIEGTAGADNPLDGTAAHDNIDGLAGNDTINGLAGDDILRGGAGNDTLDGGTGTDTADYSDATSAVTVDLSAGTATGGSGTDTLTSIEGVTGSSYDDTFDFTSASNNDVYTVDGAGGTDSINLSTYNIADAVFANGKVTIDIPVSTVAVIVQAMPAGSDVTVPVPLPLKNPDTVMVCMGARSKVAVPFLSAIRLACTQSPVPAQSTDQAVKAEPPPAVGVSVTSVPSR